MILPSVEQLQLQQRETQRVLHSTHCIAIQESVNQCHGINGFTIMHLFLAWDVHHKIDLSIHDHYSQQDWQLYLWVHLNETWLHWPGTLAQRTSELLDHHHVCVHEIFQNNFINGTKKLKKKFLKK